MLRRPQGIAERFLSLNLNPVRDTGAIFDLPSQLTTRGVNIITTRFTHSGHDTSI
jgi:hypothetical protein